MDKSSWSVEWSEDVPAVETRVIWVGTLPLPDAHGCRGLTIRPYPYVLCSMCIGERDGRHNVWWLRECQP